MVRIHTYAGAIVSIKPHDMGTVTPVRVVGVDKTEMRASAVVRRARACRLPSRLPARMQNLDVKRLRQRALDHRHISACPLVCAHHAVRPPIRPVDVVFVQGDREWVREHLMVTHHLISLKKMCSTISYVHMCQLTSWCSVPSYLVVCMESERASIQYIRRRS